MAIAQPQRGKLAGPDDDDLLLWLDVRSAIRLNGVSGVRRLLRKVSATSQSRRHRLAKIERTGIPPPRRYSSRGLVNYPLVSIVVPAYNAAEFVRNALVSVQAQTYTNYEVLLVDDGSADATYDTARRYFDETDLRGQCIRQENKGVAAARNVGIAAAQGDFIAFLDVDDVWYPRKLDAVMSAFHSHPDVDLVHHPLRIVDSNGRVLGESHNGPRTKNMHRSLLLRGNSLTPTGTTLRTDKIREIGGFREDSDLDTVEDYDLWIRIANVIKFFFLEEILGDYVVHPAGASKRIAYHHEKTENLLLDHFERYPRHDAWTRILMRRRRSQSDRFAARALTQQGDLAAARPYIRRMLRRFPVEPKNIGVVIYWLAARYRRAPSPSRDE